MMLVDKVGCVLMGVIAFCDAVCCHFAGEHFSIR